MRAARKLSSTRYQRAAEVRNARGSESRTLEHTIRFPATSCQKTFRETEFHHANLHCADRPDHGPTLGTRSRGTADRSRRLRCRRSARSAFFSDSVLRSWFDGREPLCRNLG